MLMTHHCGEIYSSTTSSIIVYVFLYVNRMGPFHQYVFSIRPTEQEAVAHFVPHIKLLNAIRWGQKKKKKVQRCADSARAACALTYTPARLKQTLTISVVLPFSHTLLCKTRIGLTDTNMHTCASTARTHMHIVPQLLVCGAPSGTPLHRNVSAAGSWEKEV